MDLIEQLQHIIRIPSFSGQEHAVSILIESWLTQRGMKVNRLENNLWVKNRYFDEAKPTILLNSHTDTVKPNGEWAVEPFSATIQDGKLIGLGANDAGASLICLMNTMFHFYEQNLPFNLIFCASAEEENSGKKGMELIRTHIGTIDFAIVGEPTNCEIAIAEKGLLVIDAQVEGTSGHAARNTGTNAIYMALNDIQRLQNYRFEKISAILGEVHLHITQINAGTQHNVIPGICTYVIDVRLNEYYSHESVVAELQSFCSATLTARSFRLKPSGLPPHHPILKVAERLQIPCFGSPTMSDQALMPWPSIKSGPGFSERSHTPNEYILLNELQQGLTHYIKLINELKHETLG